MGRNMKTLTANQYKRYLEIVKNLEISCYQQKRLLILLDNQMNELSSVLPNSLEKLKVKPPKDKITVGEIIEYIVGFALALGIIGILIGVICWIIQVFENDSISFFDYLISGAKIGGICGIILGIVGTPFFHKDEIKEYEKKKANVDAINTKIIKKRELLNVRKQQYDECYRNLCKTKDIMEKYYDLNIVYDKYRGLVPICTIYEYFDAGRCFSLEGHEGAYNLYENELRMNVIIEKLDDIISKLDEIKRNQHVLVSELKRSNQKIDEIANSLQSMQDDANLTRYYSQISAANTSYLTGLQTIKSF